MTLEEIMQRDWEQCHADDKREPPKIIRRKTRKDWHCNFDGLNTTRRESVWQSAWEVIGGILFLALLAGLCWWISR